MPSPRGLLWPSPGGSKQEYVGGAAWALQTSPRATAMATVAMSARMIMTMLLLRGVVLVVCFFWCLVGSVEEELR